MAILLGIRTINSPQANAATDTCTWTGSGADTNMSTAGNWSGCDNGNVPEDGDTLIFPSGPVNKVVTVNSDMGFGSVTFSGSGYTVSSVAFESLGVYTNLTISGNNNAFNGYVRLYPTTTGTVTHSGTGTSFGHYIAIQPLAASTDVIFDIDTDFSVPMISQTAVGVGSSIDTVTKTGIGTLDITGTAIAGITASGGIHISEGTWECDTTFCLGDDANELFLDNGSDPDGPTLHLNGNDTVPNPITTNTGAGENGSVSISADITLSGDITVNDSLNMFVSGSHTANVNSDIAIADGENLVTYGVEGYTTNAYDFGGIISGDGGIIVDDAHVTLAGTNTYTGTTELNDTGSGSLVTVKDNNSLGNHGPGSGTIVNSGSTLHFDNSGDVGYDEPITVGGSGVGGSYPGALFKTNEYVSLGGGVTLTSDTTWHNETGELFTIASVISGDYDISMTANDDSGGFGLSPGGDNTFGNLTASGLQLTLSGGGDIAIPGNLTMNAVNGKLSRIWLNNDNMLADNSVVTLNNDTSQDAVLINPGVVETLGTLQGDGVIYMGDSDAQFSIGSGDTSGEFSGTVQGYANSQFQIIDGVWTFSGYNTDIGDGFSSYYVNGGKFIANAADVSLGFSPFSISSGVLGGSGVIGPVSAYAGTIAPGNSPGCLNPDGDVAFTEFSTLSVQITGTSPCTGYDFLSASGAIALNNAHLVVGLPDGYVSHYGDEFMIVQGSSLGGTFNGLSDGSIVTIGNHQFRINYTAREVILTDITTASSSVTSLLAKTGASIYMLIVVGLSTVALASYIGLKYRSRRSIL